MNHPFLKAVALGALLLSLPALAATPDWLITSKAKLGLFTSELRSQNVQVDTNGGVVTLFGKVPTEDQRTLAEQQVKQVEGVRAVMNRLQVGPVTEVKSVRASDRKIKKAIQRALENEPSLKLSGLWVKSVDKGVATLTGQARNYTDQLRAVVVVDRVPGVQRVQSEVKPPTGRTGEESISLRGVADDQLWSPGTPRPGAGPTGGPGGTATDMRITGAVKLGLFSSPRVPATGVNVDTENGVVTLFGVVPTDDEVRAAAGLEASRVAGVTGVQNQLEVAPGQKETFGANDEDLAREVRLALLEFPELAGVDSAVRNGVVQLRGYVTSGWGELDAVRVTRQVKGVRGITNLLKVEPMEAPPQREPGT